MKPAPPVMRMVSVTRYLQIGFWPKHRWIKQEALSHFRFGNVMEGMHAFLFENISRKNRTLSALQILSQA
jgi:hypothetical protein